MMVTVCTWAGALFLVGVGAAGLMLAVSDSVRLGKEYHRVWLEGHEARRERDALREQLDALAKEKP